MPRVNFREVQNLFFGHVDAEAAGYKIVSNGTVSQESSYYRARFYPFWLHPLYKREEQPFFDYPDEAKIVFTVYPIGLIQAHVRVVSLVTDWGFSFDDPLLWPFENTGQLFVNDPVSIEQAQQLDRIVIAKDRRLAQDGGVQSLFTKWGRKPPFAVGSLPRPTYMALCNALDQLNIAWYGPRTVPGKPLPILFQAEDDYIIADDFEVEYPDITHDPIWIQGKEYKGVLNPNS